MITVVLRFVVMGKISFHVDHTMRELVMSEAKKERPKVPEGKSQYVITRQMKANEKGFVGYETAWEPFQREVKYETPKKP